MITLDDLKTFAKLPHIFTSDIYRRIEMSIAYYDACKTYIVRLLKDIGEDAYKKPYEYDRLKEFILDCPKNPYDIDHTPYLLAIIAQMKSQNCKEVHDDKV